MNNTPYFSIIIPMYNVERYIKICVDSILNQTFQDFEVIIVDDCSTDNSYEICQKLYGNNEKVHLFRQETNQGAGPTRNLALKNARGEYVWFIDGDDAILPNALEKLHKVTNVDVVYTLGHFETNQNDDKAINMKNLDTKVLRKNPCLLESNLEQRIINNWLGNRVWIFTWKVICNRKFLIENKIEFPNSRLAQDHGFILATMIFAKKYLLYRDALYIYRIRESSSWHSPNLKKSMDSLRILADSLEKIMNKVPTLADNRALKERCIFQTFEVFFRDRFRPLYNGVNIPPEFDKEVYEIMLPIFGEDTTFVKYLFNGYNNIWRQANILARQNYLLRQREDLISQQNKLLEQMKKLLDQYNKKI